MGPGKKSFCLFWRKEKSLQDLHHIDGKIWLLCAYWVFPFGGIKKKRERNSNWYVMNDMKHYCNPDQLGLINIKLVCLYIASKNYRLENVESLREVI
jgi:hypothetical protein